MTAQISFPNVYVFSGTVGGTLTITGPGTSDAEVTDDRDGTGYAETAAGDPVTYGSGGGAAPFPFTLLGVTENGDPILQNSVLPDVQLIATNEIYATDGSVTIDSSDTDSFIYCTGHEPTQVAMPNVYEFSGTVGGTITINGPGTPNAVITDDRDGNADGMTTIGDNVTYGSGGGTAPFPFVMIGVTQNGEAILQNSLLPSVQLIVTNATYATDGSVSLDTFDSGHYCYCFAPGTLIATSAGERPVEDLAIGEPILTENGRSTPVKWIGRQTISTRFGPAERLRPVLIRKGALGPGQPSRDLTVTADHAVLVDGILCNAGALVNGDTVRRIPLSELGDTLTMYHVETQAHEILLANGAAAETFIDTVSRRAFDNFAEFEALYGEVPEMVELPYPRVMSDRQLPQFLRAKGFGRTAKWHEHHENAVARARKARV